jgi:putative aldouronate transport system substrate-binding protein
VPQFLDGFPNDGSCMVDTETKKVMDYNVTDTAKRYFGKLNEEFHKGIMDPGAFNATYDQYLDKLSTGAVLGMVDQWWQFYYVIDPVFKKQNLAQLGCDYVPLPVTIDDGIHNRWHTNRMAEIDYSSGVSITTSCKDIEGAMKFVSDLLESDIIRERFWGEEGKDYSVDENGLFYLTNEQAEKKSDSSYQAAHMCSYSYFPRVEGMLDDGINAFSTEFQQNEFFRNQPVDIQECFKAYGVENYVDMLGKNEAPGSWYPMYSYSDSIPSTSECGKVKNNIVAVKKIWLPQVIMADDFDAAWNQYMDEYNACNPQIYFDYLQQKVNEN